MIVSELCIQLMSENNIIISETGFPCSQICNYSSFVNINKLATTATTNRLGGDRYKIVNKKHKDPICYRGGGGSC